MIYRGVFVGALKAERAPVDPGVRRTWLSAAVLCVNVLLMLAPPTIALGVLAGILR